MELRNKLISIAALACTVALGAGMACMTASAEEVEVAITRYAVRVNESEKDGKDTSGLRFWTETASGKAEYDEAYTIVTAEGIEGDKKVLAEVWRPENNGWNTVVAGIDLANYTTAITATSYVVKGGEVYTSNVFTSSLVQAANAALKTESNAANKAVLNKYILDAAYALEGEAELEGTYTLTGVVSKVDTAYSTQYSNVTVTIVVDGNTEQTIKCFRMAGTGADVIAVGDTITVSGTLMNYVSGETSIIEFAQGCTLDSYTISDTNKANAELAALTFDNTDVNDAAKTIALPTTAIYEGTTITWAVIAGNDNAAIANNVLSFTLPTADLVEVQVQATVVVGDVELTKTITVNVCPAGQAVVDERLPVEGQEYFLSALDTETYANSYVTGKASTYLTVGTKAEAIPVTFEKAPGVANGYYIVVDGAYVNAVSGENKVSCSATASTAWVIDADAQTITPNDDTAYVLQYNANTNQERIAKYKGTQKPVWFEAFAELTDAEKAQAASDALTLSNKKYDKDDTIELTSTGKYDATIEWAIADNAYATIDNNVVTINEWPETETTVALTATVTSGEASVTNEKFSITINAKPSEDGPTFTEKTVTQKILGTTGELASNKSSISWTSGDITFTNVKGGTAIRTSDSDHYRVYSGSQVKISTASGKITKVVVTAASDSKYKTPWKASMEAAGYTVTVNGSTYTIEIPDGAETITITATAQMRLNGVEVTYVG